MKRSLMVCAGLIVLMTATLVQWASVAHAQYGANGGGFGSQAVTLAARNRGIVNFTAAINSDGSVASCFDCQPATTQRSSTGEYQAAGAPVDTSFSVILFR